MNETEKQEFQQIANNLRDMSMPTTVSNEATMLGVNLEGWLGQIANRIEEEIR